MISEKNKAVPAEVSDRAAIGADINKLQILHLRAALPLKLTIVSISVSGTMISMLHFWQDQPLHRDHLVAPLEGMRCVYIQAMSLHEPHTGTTVIE